jgi:hypothetical protein
MQIGRLFDLFTDAHDIADFFEGVETREQLISRLELLKRQGTDDLLACLVALPQTLDRLYHDTLEMSPSSELAGEDDNQELDQELERLAASMNSTDDSAEPEVEEANPDQDIASQEAKNNQPTAG